jgi:hypothetical protein
MGGYYVNGEKCDRDALNKAIAELNAENDKLREALIEIQLGACDLGDCVLCTLVYVT